MNTKNLLDQLLRSGSELMKNQSDSTPTSRQRSDNLSGSLSSLLSDKGGAALAGGALGLLLGSKKGRKLGGKALTYGGIALIGTLAYKAYQNHQKQSSTRTHAPPLPNGNSSPTVDETHSKAILIALIAASKADGHIDERERQMIESEVRKITTDPEARHWFEEELKKPLDPTEVARHATDPSIASEMYLASLLAVDEQNFMEKTYINELARQLKLPLELQNELASQVRQVSV